MNKFFFIFYYRLKDQGKAINIRGEIQKEAMKSDTKYQAERIRLTASAIAKLEDI